VNIFSRAATRFSSGSRGGREAELSMRKRMTGPSAAGEAAGEGGEMGLGLADARRRARAGPIAAMGGGVILLRAPERAPAATIIAGA
jgi:hypothetical protein